MTDAPRHNSISPERRTPSGQPAGVFDTLSDAVTLVMAKPALMIVPLLANAALWLGPRMSIAPVFHRLANVVDSSNVENSSAIARDLRVVERTTFVSDLAGSYLPSLFTGLAHDTMLNQLVALLATPGTFGVDRDSMSGALGSTFHSPSPTLVLLAALLFLLVSSLLMTIFRVPIARAVRGQTTIPLGREIWSSWLHVVLYLLLLTLAEIVILFPLTLLSGLAMMLGSGALALIGIVMIVVGSMVGVYTYFVVDALLLHRVAPIAAFRSSYRVTRTFFPQTTRFVFLAVLILCASFALWGQMASNVPGTVLALVGNAFVGTTMAVASMLFYGDRFRILRAASASRPISRTKVNRQR